MRTSEISERLIYLSESLDATEHQFQTFVRFWAAFGLFLFGVTWKLWTPQTVFPQIPCFEFLVDVPGIVDWIALAAVGLSLIFIAVGNSFPLARIATLVFAGAATVLILLDQHRLQPWAYQFVVFAVVIVTARPRAALIWMRAIVISIYVYSAISKFDYQFIHTVGDQMLTTLTGFAGLDAAQWPESTRNWLTVSFPTDELLVGIGLAIPAVRRIAVWAAVGLHVVLILLLGPLGLNHQPGVLIWNLFFIAQAILLFGGSCHPKPAVELPEPATQSFSLTAAILSVFVILFPATQPFGFCDHWPGWEVYAPRSSRVEIVGLPDHVRIPGDSIAAWSLAELGVPVYPQARFQLGVAMAFERKFDLDRELVIELNSESNRLTGARDSETLVGRDQLAMGAGKYRLNTRFRNIWLGNGR